MDSRILTWPLLVVFALASAWCAESLAAPNKPAKKPAKKTPGNAGSSAQMKAIDAKLKQAQAALNRAKAQYKQAQVPVQAAKLKADMAKATWNDAKVALRSIENELDDYAEPGSSYGQARKAYRAANEEYTNAKKEAEAAAETNKFKDAAARFKFVQEFAPLATARARRTETGRRYSAERENALKKDSQWVAVNRSIQTLSAAYRAAEKEYKQAAAQLARVRGDGTAAVKAIAQLQHAKKSTQANYNKQIADARQQRGQSGKQNNNRPNNKKKPPNNRRR